jgi:U3 small nucleolar RNA-associated protein 23
VIYGLKKSLLIEQPSVHQRKFAQLDEEKRLNMDISEYNKLLKEAASEGKAADNEDATGGEQRREKQV